MTGIYWYDKKTKRILPADTIYPIYRCCSKNFSTYRIKQISFR